MLFLWLLCVGDVSLFSLPKLYELNKVCTTVICCFCFCASTSTVHWAMDGLGFVVNRHSDISVTA